jgi:nucleoside-diphosphate-sugar epimerase
MNILVVGNQGYVGPVLIRHLRERFPESAICGYDTGYFAHCLTGATSSPEVLLDAQYYGDVRSFPTHFYEDFDAIVLLAAISNDPMGNQFEDVTRDINYLSCCEIARGAVEAGVERIVFASSCSMYGAASGVAKTETDELNPLTAYARSKVDTETFLQQLDQDVATITSLRFATACGMSDRLRLDLVLNDFVASALVTGKVTVLSDGSPWRPLISVKDMARAIEWALIRDPEDGGRYLAVNAGSNRWNYQVKDLAEAVVGAIPGSVLDINSDAPPDKRSYKVDFSLYERLAPDHQPLATLEGTIAELVDGVKSIPWLTADFRTSNFMRLNVIKGHLERGTLDSSLLWTGR